MVLCRKISDKTLVIIVLIVLIMILGLIPFEKLVGKPSILGLTIAKLYVKSAETNSTCIINLYDGWNLISIACKPVNTTPSNVLSPLNGNYTSIHTFDPSEALDYWKSYNPSMPTWVIQDLSTISDKYGYWINANNSNNLTVNGTITSPNTLNLIKGWNLISYPSDESESPANAFSSISGSYSIVWAYNTSEDVYLYYNPSLGSNTLNEINPNKGYWINLTVDNNLVVS